MIVPWHLEKKLHHGWRDWFSRFLEGGSQKINSDFKPLGLFYSISHWNALFAPSLSGLFRQFERINIRIIVLVFVFFLLFFFFFRSKLRRFLKAGIPLSIITTGFAGMMFDLMIIFTFQSIYGYVFSWIGILVASFMAGAACGAMVITKALARIKNCFNLFIKIELAIICFSIAFPVVFLAMRTYTGNFEVSFFYDIGYLGNTPGDERSSNVRSATGIGFRYVTPVGAIGLAYGHKLNPERHENNGRLHFSIGYTF